MGSRRLSASVPAASKRSRSAGRRKKPRRANPWNPLAPLLVGLCFGLAYAVTGRLLEGRLGGLVKLGHRFEPKAVPGTTLESLRMRFGAERVDLLAPAPQPEQKRDPDSESLNAAAESTQPSAAELQELPLIDPLEGLLPLPLTPAVESAESFEPVVIPEQAEFAEPSVPLVITEQPQPALPAAPQPPFPSATVGAPPPPRR